ncbi:MAG: NAD(P)/FAD-dependent oxidoreductase [Chitinophagaceae bacterium]|nr:NAD(P)/FAD-dependent oxidoreductase [Chitinophagaceae bacterium]
MHKSTIYDCIIVGGGLAGLSLSIQLAKLQHKVLLLEKKSYPSHKVCGEYLSAESEDFLQRLGLDLSSMNLPRINQFLLTSPNGAHLSSKLDLGGIGISRFKLDYELFKLAKANGVTILENTTVSDFHERNNYFEVNTHEGKYIGKYLCASYGKHAFGSFYKPPSESENWVGIKYHIQLEFPKNLIALHNFRGGYCGISNIENDRCCLCYLVKASTLKKYQHQIPKLEREVLRKNPYLDNIFSKANFLFDKPLTISNVKFSVKKPVFNHVFYLGDSAGSIAPLSGNGMSIALRSAYELAPILDLLLQERINRQTAFERYETCWNKNFKQRISAGRKMQHFFCKEYLTGLSIAVIRWIKPLQQIIIKQTHGKPF